MHEVGIAEELLGLAQEELSRIGYQGPVPEVTIAVGRLSGANPDALRFAFESLCEKTRLAGAKLSIIETCAMCRCSDCGTHEEVDAHNFSCPKCNGVNITIDGGRDLCLHSLEIDEDES